MMRKLYTLNGLHIPFIRISLILKIGTKIGKVISADNTMIEVITVPVVKRFNEIKYGQTPGEIRNDMREAIRFIISVSDPNIFLTFELHPKTHSPFLRIFTDPSIRTYFKIYNAYEDASGSEAEKTIAVAEFVGMDRLDILRLKRKYGLLSAKGNIGDEEAIRLF